MFETPQEFILKNESLDSPDETQRFAYCQIHLKPLTYAIAKEVSAELAGVLFELTNPGKHERNVYQPRHCIKHLVLEQTFKAHELIFRHHPELPIIGKISPVEIRDVQAQKTKHSTEFTLILGLRFKIADRGVASALLIDRWMQPVAVTLNELQFALPLDGIPEYLNDKASARQLSIGNGGR